MINKVPEIDTKHQSSTPEPNLTSEKKSQNSVPDAVRGSGSLKRNKIHTNLPQNVLKELKLQKFRSLSSLQLVNKF